MSRLYCEQHGREHEARVIGNDAIYRQEGESVLVVSGRLKSGPWLCDQCNATLERGISAVLISAFPAGWTETMDDYDFDYERQYFTPKHAEAAVHGTPWPGMDATGPIRIPPRDPNRRRREPLCALDLLSPEELEALPEEKPVNPERKE